MANAGIGMSEYQQNEFRQKAIKDYDLLDECEPKGANYQGTQWFFENLRREEHTKDDSFVQIDFNNVYEMDGVVPLRQPDKFGLDDDDEPSKRDDAEQNPNQLEAWLGSPPAVNGSPSANNRESSGRKVIEGGPAVKRPMTGKAEIRSKVKISESGSKQQKQEKLISSNINEADNDEYCRQMLQAQLNKTTKFCRKPVIGSNNGWTNSTGFSASTKDPKPFGPSGSRFNGHNYTVSINFNRPQQSKGTRPIRGNKAKVKKNEIIQSNNFFRGGMGFESPSKQSNNIQEYDILPNTSKEGYADAEASTRKRQSKTAIGGKRTINISKSKKIKENPIVGSKMMYDSQKPCKPLSLENTENLEGIEFQAFLNDHNEFENENFGEINENNGRFNHNFKSQTTTLPFHSSLGIDFLNLFANSGS